jgi:hypothetical protein
VKSCAHWLNWKCGIDLGAARERVRVAHALEKLPQIAAAMTAGRLSYAKVRAMTRVAEASNENYILNIALCGTASHVEQVVRGYRRALDAAEVTRDAIQQRDQSLWFHTESDGSMVIRARVPAEIGALFRKALEAAEDSLPIPKGDYPLDVCNWISHTCPVLEGKRWPNSSRLPTSSNGSPRTTPA